MRPRQGSKGLKQTTWVVTVTQTKKKRFRTKCSSTTSILLGPLSTTRCKSASVASSSVSRNLQKNASFSWQNCKEHKRTRCCSLLRSRTWTRNSMWRKHITKICLLMNMSPNFVSGPTSLTKNMWRKPQIKKGSTLSSLEPTWLRSLLQSNKENKAPKYLSCNGNWSSSSDSHQSCRWFWKNVFRRWSLSCLKQSKRSRMKGNARICTRTTGQHF